MLLVMLVDAFNQRQRTESDRRGQAIRVEDVVGREAMEHLLELGKRLPVRARDRSKLLVTPQPPDPLIHVVGPVLVIGDVRDDRRCQAEGIGPSSGSIA